MYMYYRGDIVCNTRRVFHKRNDALIIEKKDICGLFFYYFVLIFICNIQLSYFTDHVDGNLCGSTPTCGSSFFRKADRLFCADNAYLILVCYYCGCEDDGSRKTYTDTS